MPTVLVTGAYGGLGSVVAAHLEHQGWSVVAPRREDGDLSTIEAVRAIVDGIDKPLTGIVHLVGGIIAGNPVEDTLPAEFQEMFTLNVTTLFNVLHAGIPRLRAAGGGSIVTIGAQSVLHPVADRAAYSASKSAVVSLTQAVAEEGRATGIRANCLLPSIINTEANRQWGTPEQIAEWITPEAIARTIAELLAPTNGVSGAVIPMYGRLPY